MQTEKTLGGLIKVVYEMRAEGERFELNPKLRKYFGKIGLTADQIDLVIGIARRIVQRQRAIR